MGVVFMSSRTVALKLCKLLGFHVSQYRGCAQLLNMCLPSVSVCVSSYLCLCAGGCLCEAGWEGDDCSVQCRQGSYGTNCSQVCQCLNNATCDSASGLCHCLPGFTGKYCQSSMCVWCCVCVCVAEMKPDRFAVVTVIVGRVLL